MSYKDLFGEDIMQLQQGKHLSPATRLTKLSPFLDEQGILLLGGWLQRSMWEFDRRHTIILGKHYITEVLIVHHHVQRKHQGVEALLAFLLQMFWIIGGRRLVRMVKGRCVKRRRYDAAPGE